MECPHCCRSAWLDSIGSVIPYSVGADMLDTPVAFRAVICSRWRVHLAIAQGPTPQGIRAADSTNKVLMS